MATRIPALNIPPSSATVSVAVIDTTSRIIAKTGIVVQPHIPGHDEFHCPCFSFLISRSYTRESVLFDLGIRKDPENFAPRTRRFAAAMHIESEKNVADILGDIRSEISAIIWSHHHFDHIGDPSKFPPSAKLVVGAGFKAEFLPGYPANEESWILESDYVGREIYEINFHKAGLMLGQYNAYDYFGDGSFYLLDCPGHTIAHMMGLARTTPTTFVLMAADCCHHGGEFRPTHYKPLPGSIVPNPLLNSKAYPRSIPCPGSLFVNIHPKKSRIEPFYELINPKNSETVREATRSQSKLEEFDASDDILVLTAHDADAANVIDLYPATVDDWKSQGWKEKLQWAFLKDFQVE